MLKQFKILIIFLSIFSPLKAEENLYIDKEHQWNFYSGTFDFSDDGARSTLFGVQHNARYVYTGVQAEYKLGGLNFIPSFSPGLYGEGDGKDLGHIIEFKSEVQLSIDLFKDTELGFSYNHLSNASLGDKNPGANSYMFNFLKRF